VDVTATLQRKLDALRAHPSQIRHPDRLEPRIRDWAREEGQAIGVEAAEALRVIVIEDDEAEEAAGQASAPAERAHPTPPDAGGEDEDAG
jgi:hypothetical protein